MVIGWKNDPMWRAYYEMRAARREQAKLYKQQIDTAQQELQQRVDQMNEALRKQEEVILGTKTTKH